MATTYEEPPFVEESTAAPSIPHSIEAEESVIGSILINPDIYYDLAHFLRADDFYIHRLRWIWMTFSRLHEERTPIDMLTVSEDLDRLGKLGEVGGPAYITSLINKVPTSLNAEHYGRIVEAHSIRRKAIAAANTIAQEAYNQENTTVDLVDTMMEQAIRIANHSNGEKRLVAARQAAEDEWCRMERVSKEGEPDGVRTGYADIDSIIKTLAPGDLNIIAGRTGMGKTSFLQSMVHNNLKEYRKNILIAQAADLNRAGWMQRLMAMETGIPLDIIRTARMDEEQMTSYVQGYERVCSYGFMIDDTPNITAEKLLSVARRADAHLRGLDLIVVDYIQKMGVPKDVSKRLNRVGEIDHITSGLKFIARELNVPVLAAAQLSRSVEQRNDQRPRLSDLRESGAIEQDSQLVMFIYREDQVKSDSKRQNVAEIIVAKNTNGCLGTAELVWRGAFTRFENAAKY